MEGGEVDRIVKEKKTTTVTETREIVYFTHRLPSSIAISTRVFALLFCFYIGRKLLLTNFYSFSCLQLASRLKTQTEEVSLSKDRCKLDDFEFWPQKVFCFRPELLDRPYVRANPQDGWDTNIHIFKTPKFLFPEKTQYPTEK